VIIDLYERAPWKDARVFLLISPGGAGKSSLGVELAPLLERDLIDLDFEFERRVGGIEHCIRVCGYRRYKEMNSKLAETITADTMAPTILVASSGFLTIDNPEQALSSNRRILEACYSMCLLPLRSFEEAVQIIVERQMSRSFGSNRAREEAKIRERYAVYAELGDSIVFSTASSHDIARGVAARLRKPPF
jgi:shikimate kinase